MLPSVRKCSIARLSESESSGEDDDGASGHSGGGVKDGHIDSLDSPSVVSDLVSASVADGTNLGLELVLSLEFKGIGGSLEGSLDAILGLEDLIEGGRLGGGLGGGEGASLDSVLGELSLEGGESGEGVEGCGGGEGLEVGIHVVSDGLLGFGCRVHVLLSADEGIPTGIFGDGGGLSSRGVCEETGSGIGGGSGSGLLEGDGGVEPGVGGEGGGDNGGGGEVDVESVGTFLLSLGPVFAGNDGLVVVRHLGHKSGLKRDVLHLFLVLVFLSFDVIVFILSGVDGGEKEGGGKDRFHS